MSFIHNRTGALALVAALAVLLLGAGCGKQSGPAEPAAPTNADAASKPADAGLPERWTEYRSEKLGITIPYPEGWYVEEKTEEETGNRSVDFYESEPPTTSDAPSALWLERRTTTDLELVIQEEFPVVRSREPITRSGIEMTRVSYPYDERLAPEVGMSTYIWQDRNGITMIGGPEGSAVLEYVLDRMGVLP